MIRVTNLSKTFGEQDLFDEVNITLGEKEKIGLIGRNGSGKSTFLKILLDQESYDSGEIEIPETCHIASLEQNIDFTENSILEQVSISLSGDVHSQQWKVKSILMGLGFTESDFEKTSERIFKRTPSPDSTCSGSRC